MSSTKQAVNLKDLSAQQLTAFFDSFDTVLTDCDGVLWVEMTALRQSAEVINTFQDIGKQVFYVTNNSTKTREQFADKCKALNFKVSQDHLYCTSNLAAMYLKSINFRKKVYVIGSQGVAKELDKVGIEHVGTGPDPLEAGLSSLHFEKDPEVGAVIVGFDEHFSYPKMTKAASYLHDPNVIFIGTNTDNRFPAKDDVVVPGTGSLVSCIETCSERRATIMGKPEPFICEVLKTQCNIDPARTLMIGDRDRSDILLGTRCGFKTLLVLSGVTSLQDVERCKKSSCKDDSDLVPDYYIDTLGDLYPDLEKYKLQNGK